MEEELLLGVVLLIPRSNWKSNLTNLQHHKVQQKGHFETEGIQKYLENSIDPLMEETAFKGE